MSMYDTLGTEAETVYRRQQIARQYRNANRRNRRDHHQGRLNRWREARHNYAA